MDLSYCNNELPGGAEGNRTPDLLIANEALYHLSYGPLEASRKARNNPFGAPRVKRLSVLRLACAVKAARTGAIQRTNMAAIIDFVFTLLQGLIQLFIWAVIISAVMSWLVAFDVINLRNAFVANVARFLDAVTRPILAPVQRIIPSLGGIDISPIIVIMVLSLASGKLLTPLKYYLMAQVS